MIAAPSDSRPYSVAALAAAAVSGVCGAAALAIRSGGVVVGTADQVTVHVVALVACPPALFVVTTALWRYGRSRPEGLAVWSLGIVLLAAPGAWFVLSFTWRMVRVFLAS